MPRAWSDKQERKYEHIKESSRERGHSMARAKEIAARMVNKGLSILRLIDSLESPNLS